MYSGAMPNTLATAQTCATGTRRHARTEGAVSPHALATFTANPRVAVIRATTPLGSLICRRRRIANRRVCELLGWSIEPFLFGGVVQDESGRASRRPGRTTHPGRNT